MNLEGKVAFVTGVARGQGRSHAVHLARDGAHIIGIDALKSYQWMNYRLAEQADADETIRLVEKEGRRLFFRRADVTDLPSVESALNAGVAELGRLDVVVANAGALPKGSLTWEADPEAWRECVAVNLLGVFHTVHAAIPHMLAAGNGGAIVITSSGAALVAGSHLSDYSAAKAALLNLTRTLAVELAPHSIRVNAICPGAVNTEMIANEALYRMFRPDLESPTREDTLDIWRSKHLLPVTWLEPEDISNAVAWLASDQARFVTGITLPVDAGNTIKFA
ncbi:MAG: mycofactocin-coupled SDR family oxidoreductase [Acidimicrobiales bacterium]